MLRKLFRTLMERPDKDVTNIELAGAINYDDSSISKWFNYDTSDLSFRFYLSAIRFLAPEREDELIEIVAMEMVRTENRQNCRHLMEYASTTRNFQLLQNMIDLQKNVSRENKDWAEIYGIALSFQKKSKPLESILQTVERYKPKNHTTRVFSLLLKSNILYRMGEYSFMFKIAKEVEKEIDKIKNVYIKECYSARLSEIFARGYLYQRGDVKKARFYANNVINSKFLCSKFTAHTYHLLGTSYVFENRELSLRYFETYKKLLEQQERNDLINEVTVLDIFFVNTLWGQASSENETCDNLEKMHYYARIGEYEKVNEIFYDREEHSTNPFALCYLGIAKEDPHLLLQSLASFIEKGDRFFAELPRREIEKFPGYIFSATVMCNINIA
ncbi:AimR family lysis-lysogeny pheromone receptor [Cytobacillus purgationiresistens]|uniref:Uncharacterized protein n=1 Tax=Cytobacillus purgationiresistens TaxID=863449 RepID=A0ABU0AHP3_9BACI|nr:AimR family lysis-lysogeny pheromone receptor [Cytobacillus purgationiresistens]MDQ0270779.1 hypothetical protein [Cytobacillus purgationiresistens]